MRRTAKIPWLESEMNGVFFGAQEIEEIRNKVATRTWAANAFDKIHRALAVDREQFLAGTRPFTKGGDRAKYFIELALCSRVVDEWHREAVERMLRDIDDLPKFVGSYADASTGRLLGLDPLMLSVSAQNLCLGLDFLDNLDNDLGDRLFERVLFPIAETIDNVHRGAANWQTNLNLGLLSIALATGERQYLHAITSDPTRSFAYHLAVGVHPDGFWHEQCPASYHMGTIERFLRTRWIADRNGIELGGDEVLRKMIDSVVGMALPGGELPLIGDASLDKRVPIGRISLLETAYAKFQVPWTAWALARTKRDDLWSVLVGRDLEEAAAPKPRSGLFASSGLCVLKHGNADSYWDGKGSGTTISFGPHGDWHGHAGKLGIEYRHNKHYLIRDSAISHGYGLPIHRNWFMTTVAHSTVVVDGKNQSFTWTKDRAEQDRYERGVCHAHLFRDEVAGCTVSADFAYPGSKLVRTLFQTADYLLDIMECSSLDGSEQTYDWILHTGGLIQSELPFEHASLGYYKNGYDYIREVESHATDNNWKLDVMDCHWAADIWKTTGQAMSVSMLGESGTTIFKGVCPAPPRDVYDPVILVRRRATSTVFIALHVPGEREFGLECVENKDGNIICQVSGDGGTNIFEKRQDAAGGVELRVMLQA